MPAAGPVYQPTTVSYETRPGGFLSQTNSVSPLKVLKKPIPQIMLLIFALFFTAAGIYLSLISEVKFLTK